MADDPHTDGGFTGRSTATVPVTDAREAVATDANAFRERVARLDVDRRYRLPS